MDDQSAVTRYVGQRRGREGAPRNMTRVSHLEEVLCLTGLKPRLDVLAKVALVLLGLLLLHGLHILLHVSSEDILCKDLGVHLLLALVVANHALLIVWDLEASVEGSLEGSKDL